MTDPVLCFMCKYNVCMREYELFGVYSSVIFSVLRYPGFLRVSNTQATFISKATRLLVWHQVEKVNI